MQMVRWFHTKNCGERKSVILGLKNKHTPKLTIFFNKKANILDKSKIL